MQQTPTATSASVATSAAPAKGSFGKRAKTTMFAFSGATMSRILKRHSTCVAPKIPPPARFSPFCRFHCGNYWEMAQVGTANGPIGVLSFDALSTEAADSLQELFNQLERHEHPELAELAD